MAERNFEIKRTSEDLGNLRDSSNFAVREVNVQECPWVGNYLMGIADTLNWLAGQDVPEIKIPSFFVRDEESKVIKPEVINFLEELSRRRQ